MIDDSVYRLEDAWPAEQRGPWGSMVGFTWILAIPFPSKRLIFLCVSPIFGPSVGIGFEEAPPAYYYSTPCSLQDSSIGSEDASFLIRFLEL